MEPSSRPLYLVCTRKEVCNLLNRILCRKHVAARKGTNGNVARSTLTSELLDDIRLACYNNTILLPLMSPHDRSSLIKRSQQTSKHTVSCLACNVTLTDAHMPCTNLSSKHAKHLSYQRFKHACLVRRSRSLARRSSRLRHLLQNLRYSETVH